MYKLWPDSVDFFAVSIFFLYNALHHKSIEKN